ncbi:MULTISPECIES: tagaturonate reductase [Metabacillus]|uniref:Altronate oxidoreductase n=2 Tax=Metabacillus TaxID=2675233 RepID=A0A179SKZ8_9BACI|nr:MULTISPECIES: tagaturonate reductase [Metabacillus]OAS82064.1 altronate oxidoreductase [Metabacillus litoralis]QNF29731.1 tagaturonate reductase [Metabacillus sp. KUDC1714]
MQNLTKELVDNDQLYPEKVLQFGTGNFLRAFTDWQIHEMNKQNLFNGCVVVVQSTSNGTVDTINEQDGLYTLYLQGIKDQKPVSEHEVISSVSRGINLVNNYGEYLAMAKNPELRFIISNTTEAGITFQVEDQLHDRPQKSFPGKLTAFLYERFQVFKGDPSKGFIIFPCELIEENGKELKRIVLQYAHTWNLETEFIDWVVDANTFCNTLVDRIVPGFPKDTIKEKTEELGYIDKLVVVGEQFHLFVIEGPEFVKDEFPAEKAGLNVHVVDDLSSYRLKKVKILNGAHTLMTPVAYLYGLNTVSEAVTTDIMKEYVEDTILNEILPTLSFSKEELTQFTEDVLNRFKNPFIHHYLSSIALNSISKFKARILPTLLDFVDQFGKLPKGIVFSLSALIYFYKGKRGTEEIDLVDDEVTLTLFKELWSNCDESEMKIGDLVSNILADERLWGLNLNEIPNLTESVTRNVVTIAELGMTEALKQLPHLKGEYNESVY